MENFDYGNKGCYFVTLCTQDQQHLFEIEPNNVGNDLCVVPLQNQIIHKWIKETQNKFQEINFDKYVIMPDHLHFIITIAERHTGRSLQDIMQFFKTMTTNEYMRLVKNNQLPYFHKKIWQKSFYDHIIRDQNDYNEIWEYIEYNPKKWILTHTYKLYFFFVVFIEEIKTRLILPQSFLRSEYSSLSIISVFEKRFSQYSVS